MGKRKKLVTADDYRKDRDYWKRRALKRQRVIDTIRRHNDRLTNDRDANKSALEYFRQALKEVCPHDKLDYEMVSYAGDIYCNRCNNFVVGS